MNPTKSIREFKLKTNYSGRKIQEKTNTIIIPTSSCLKTPSDQSINLQVLNKQIGRLIEREEIKSSNLGVGSPGVDLLTCVGRNHPDQTSSHQFSYCLPSKRPINLHDFYRTNKKILKFTTWQTKISARKSNLGTLIYSTRFSFINHKSILQNTRKFHAWIIGSQKGHSENDTVSIIQTD